MISRDLDTNNKDGMQLMTIEDAETDERYAAIYDLSHFAIPRKGDKINVDKLKRNSVDNPEDLELEEELGPFIVEEISYEYSVIESESEGERTDALICTVNMLVSES